MLDAEQMALVVVDRKDKTKVDKRRQDKTDRYIDRQVILVLDLPMLDAEQMALVVVDRKDKTKVDKRRQDKTDRYIDRQVILVLTCPCWMPSRWPWWWWTGKTRQR